MTCFRECVVVVCVTLFASFCDGISCNDGIDCVMPCLQKDIKCVSPHEAEIEYCTKLIVWGGDSIGRNGDVSSERKDDCIHNKVNFCFARIYFECSVNMEAVKKAIEKETGTLGKVALGKRKRRGMMDELEETFKQDNVINGTWDGLCLGGTLKCASDKCTTNDFFMTKIDLVSLIIDCYGGVELTQLCEKGKAGGPFMEKLKSMLMSFMQIEFLRIVTGCITDGPAKIAQRLNCENPGKVSDHESYNPANCKSGRKE